MLQIQDRVKETSVTVGVGPLALAGALTGYRTFGSVASISDTAYYAIEGVDGSGNPTGEWEVGLGTYSGAAQLTRTTVLSSSNAGAAVNFSAGTKQVWLDAAAALMNDWARLSGSAFTGHVGFGQAAPTNVATAANVALATGATDLAGHFVNGIFGSGGTGNVASFWSEPQTAVAAYTVTSFIHYYAKSGTLGAGSSVTSSYGFRVDNAALIGTNRYGFYSNVASAANTLQLFMSGTGFSQFNGNVGVLSPPLADQALTLGISTGTATTKYGIISSANVPSTTTALAVTFSSNLGTAAAAFTIVSLRHFEAINTSLGAGSSITNLYGFYASNAIAKGTNSYGFYCDFASAANIYAFRAAGTAESFFSGSVTVTGGASQLYMIGAAGVHANTGVTLYGVQSDITSPATNTANLYVFRGVGRTTATAYTLGNMTFFFADSAVLGAGSTITNIRGFYAPNSLAGKATTTIGFYCDINDATNTWQLQMSGTAPSRFDGSCGFGGQTPTTTTYAVRIGFPTTITATTAYLVALSGAGPAATTTAVNGFCSIITSAASAYTLASLNHFNAVGQALGAGSTITSVRGFYAGNSIAVGTNNYGFFCDFSAAANTFQLSMQGAAASRFGGPVYFAQDNSTTQAVSALFQGTGVPSNTNGNNGDFYLRGDTPGTANQRLYVKSAGAWVGIV